MKNRRRSALLSLIDPLRRSESGSAMTEFVIGLPVFILIFSGLGMLFRYNVEGMAARMKTIQDLSTRASAVNSWQDFVPNNGGSLAATSFGDINIPGSGQDGYLVDAGKKANIGGQFGQIRQPANPPTADIAAITGTTGSFANNLLDDSQQPPGSVDGWAELIRGVINLAGANPSIGAGIRYIPITANESHAFTHSWGGGAVYNPGTVDLSAPTAATHRAFPVALARLEMNRLNPYRSALLEFTSGVPEDSEMEVTGGLPAGSNLSQNAANECESQADTYTACVQNPASAAAAAAMGNCGSIIFPRDCEVSDVCEDLEPDDSCMSAAEDTDIFNSGQCDAQARCARPNRDNRGDEYDNIDFDGFP